MPISHVRCVSAGRALAPVFAVVSVCAGLAAGCTQSDYCAGVFPNATVTDVIHDDRDDLLHVAVHHSLSYCTGTDEPRYSIEHITVDLSAGEVMVDQRTGDTLAPAAFPEVCCSLYRDGNFSSGDCPGCELTLRSLDGRDAFRFTAGAQDLEEVMTLEVSREDVPIAVVDIGGYMSQAR